MAREIQFDDVLVERSEGWKPSATTWTQTGDRVWSVLKESKRFKVECLDGPDSDGNVVVRINGVKRVCRVMDERAKLLETMGMSISGSAGTGDVHAPMPGKVLQVLVKPGDNVEEGSPLLVLEAMKMENVIKSSMSGTVQAVPAGEGQAVEKGALLVGFEG